MDDVISQLSFKGIDAKINFVVQREGNSPLTKRMDVQVLDRSGNQSLLGVFTFPSNMKGTSFLAVTNSERDDEYHLYLRTLRRVKRVPNSSENFMLRDFLSLYFMKPRPEMWSFKEGESSREGAQDVVKVEGLPVDGRTTQMTGYSRVVHWVELRRKVILRSEFYGSDGALSRTQKVTEFTRVGGVWFPSVFETDDLTEGAKARVELLEITLKDSFPDDWFTVRHLKTF